MNGVPYITCAPEKAFKMDNKYIHKISIIQIELEHKAKRVLF